MYSIRYILILLNLCFVISGCVNQVPASIDYKYINKKTSSDNVVSERTELVQIDEPIIMKPINKIKEDVHQSTGILQEPDGIDNKLTVSTPIKKQDNEKTIYHKVQEGETLEQIANDYQQDVQVIADLNDLSPPYNIHEEQLIELKITNEKLNQRNKVIKTDAKPKEVDRTLLHLPVQGYLVTSFGEETKSGKSKGISISAALGSEIKSISDGIVKYSGYHKKFGNLIIIETTETGFYIAYAHMQDLILQKGAKIVKEEIIGHVGDSGDSEGQSQLYLAIKNGKTSIDPLEYIHIINK